MRTLRERAERFIRERSELAPRDARDACLELEDLLREVEASEREACAKLAEASDIEASPGQIAADIRARGGRKERLYDSKAVELKKCVQCGQAFEPEPEWRDVQIICKPCQVRP